MCRGKFRFTRFSFDGQYVELEHRRRQKVLLPRVSISTVQLRPVPRIGLLLFSIWMAFVARGWFIQQHHEQSDENGHHFGPQLMGLVSMALFITAMVSSCRRRLVIVAHSGDRYIHYHRRPCARGSTDEECQSMFDWFRLRTENRTENSAERKNVSVAHTRPASVVVQVAPVSGSYGGRQFNEETMPRSDSNYIPPQPEGSVQMRSTGAYVKLQ